MLTGGIIFRVCLGNHIAEISRVQLCCVYRTCYLSANVLALWHLHPPTPMPILPTPPPPHPHSSSAYIAKAVPQLLIILIPPPPEMPSLQTCTTVPRSIFLHYNNTCLAAGFCDSYLQSQHCRRQRKGDQNILPVLATWQIQDQSWLHTSRPSWSI